MLMGWQKVDGCLCLHASRVLGEQIQGRSPAPLSWRECQQFCCLANVLSPEIQLPFIIVVICLDPSNSWLFSCAQDRRVCVLAPQQCPFWPQDCVGVRLPLLPCLSPAIFVLSFYPSLCRRHSLRPQSYFRMNCCACRYRLSVCVGGGGLLLFLCCHFGLASFSFTF